VRETQQGRLTICKV